MAPLRVSVSKVHPDGWEFYNIDGDILAVSGQGGANAKKHWSFWWIVEKNENDLTRFNEYFEEYDPSWNKEIAKDLFVLKRSTGSIDEDDFITHMKELLTVKAINIMMGAGEDKGLKEGVALDYYDWSGPLDPEHMAHPSEVLRYLNIDFK